MNLNTICKVTTLATALLCSLAARADLIPLTNDVTANATWRATNTYLLQTMVYVRSNATLTIEPGTVIRASTNAATLLPRDGVPNVVAGLWVTRGAKLMASGTADKPIIFTIEGDDLNNPNDLPYNLSGQWGGVVLCGRAQLNSAAFADGNAATPKFERFEGTTADGPEGAHFFGGNDDTDNSGVLRYISIRYPGSVFAPARELNGLTMGAVGRGTTIEYVEVLNSSDDAFEWWGGSVNTKYLVAAFAEDDDFDTDQGYRGTNQFWFGIKPPWAGSSDSRGFETDGDLNQNATGEVPKSQWFVHNATLIGRGTTASGFGGGVGWNARDEAAPNVVNSLFAEFAAGILVDADGTNEFVNGQADLRNSIFQVGAAQTGSAAASVAFLFSDAARSNSVENALLGGISYTNNATLDPRPQSGSPALRKVAPQGAGLTVTTYRGAFAPTASWADGWTALSKAGVLKTAPVPVVPPGTVLVAADIAADTTWHATNTYLLQTMVYVRSNATLTIEPGTVIRASVNAATLIPRDGIPNVVAGLWVTRGAKLMAAGTADKPIIFTMEGDDLNNPNDLPYNLSGQWGGLVLCGRAQLNTAAFADGNAATPKFERFEGTTSEGIEGAHFFGGNDDADDSGVLRYVSIRYPGSVFAPARELNGLTMGAVGGGTTIEYVEVVNSSDDAFEWWGGNVNTKYLVAVFCEDDDFDTDQGYRGTNQFWFGIKPPWAGSSDSRGFETDGDLNQNAAGELPKSQWTVHNATLIGRGIGVNGFGGGVGWNARDEAAPNVINSIFAEFASGVLVDADGANEFVNAQADLRNSIFQVGTNLTGAAAGSVAFLFSDATRSNSVENARLGGVSYTNNAALDPRPRSGSPALNKVAPRGAALTATTYRGAFAPDSLWTAGWTFLDQAGFTPEIIAPAQLAVALGNGNVRISFVTQAGVTYQLQSNPNLSSNAWSDEGAPATGVGGSFAYTISVNDAAQKFFRVIAR